MKSFSSILVTGANGQLAQGLHERHAQFNRMGYRLHVQGRPQLDLRVPETIEGHVLRIKPAMVINTAAYTAVDDAETHRNEAAQLNVTAAGALAAVCATHGIPLIHISTDYVFDGHLGQPYKETDLAAPINVYGETKLAGEEAVLRQGGPAIIVRTSWLYSRRATNFLMNVLTILSNGKKPQMEIVNDQKGRPTSVEDLVQALAVIVTKIDGGYRDTGIFHVAGGGEATWYEFAEEIFKNTARYGWRPLTIVPITTEQRASPAKRPADSRLDCAKTKAVFGIELPDWRRSLDTMITDICIKGNMPGRQRHVVPSNPIKNPGAVPKSLYPT